MSANLFPAQSRDMNMDLLRVAACVAVVGLHTVWKDLSLISSTVYYLFGFAIPCFWMTSGAFLMNRGPMEWKYAVKKPLKILRLVLIWNAIALLIKYIAGALSGSPVPVSPYIYIMESLFCLIQRGSLTHFWYLGALIIVYLLLPLLTRLSHRQQRLLLILCAAAALGFQGLSTVLGYSVQKLFPQSLRLWTWIFYFLLGGILHRSEKALPRAGLVTAALTFFVLIYHNIAGRYVISLSYESGLVYAECFYDSVFTMLWAACIFSFAKSLPLSERAKRITARLSPLTTGIYIIHIIVFDLIMGVFNRSGGQYSHISLLLGFVSVLLISAALTELIRRTPLAKYLIQL